MKPNPDELRALQRMNGVDPEKFSDDSELAVFDRIFDAVLGEKNSGNLSKLKVPAQFFYFPEEEDECDHHHDQNS